MYRDLKHKLSGNMWKFVFGMVVVDAVCLIGLYMFKKRLPPPKPPKFELSPQEDSSPPTSIHSIISAELNEQVDLNQEIVITATEQLNFQTDQLNSQIMSSSGSEQQVSYLSASPPPMLFTDLPLDSGSDTRSTPSSDSVFHVDTNDPRLEAFSNSPYSVISSHSAQSMPATPEPAPTIQQRFMNNLLSLKHKFGV